MSLQEWLSQDPERCEHGWHRTQQFCPECPDADDEKGDS
jgi:hypothetical protein